jgi:hypothetical protein
MPTIYAHDNSADGLTVTVTADWTVGKFRVQFRDTDADAVIETRTYSNPDAAIAYARKLIGDNKP